MTEREMEDLLWEYPEKLLNEPVTQFQRQPASAVGRADLIFEDRIGRLLVVELKRDTLERGAISQLVDYYGMLKTRFPNRAVELMIVASRIPKERRISCEQFDIEAREIPQKRFRDVAEEVGYSFKSEGESSAAPTVEESTSSAPVRLGPIGPTLGDPPLTPTKVEKGWFHWKDRNGDNYFLAFVNARGSCSMRAFEAGNGSFRRKEYKSGDFQESFLDYVQGAVPLYVSRQPNLERDCKHRLPTDVLAELKRQSHPETKP